MKKRYTVRFDGKLVSKTMSLSTAYRAAAEAAAQTITSETCSSYTGQGEPMNQRQVFALQRAGVPANVLMRAGRLQILVETLTFLGIYSEIETPQTTIRINPGKLKTALFDAGQVLGLVRVRELLEAPIAPESRTPWDFPFRENLTLATAACCECGIPRSELIDRTIEAGLGIQVGAHKFIFADSTVLVTHGNPPSEFDITDVWDAQRHQTQYDIVKEICETWSAEEMTRASAWCAKTWPARLV